MPKGKQWYRMRQAMAGATGTDIAGTGKDTLIPNELVQLPDEIAEAWCAAQICEPAAAPTKAKAETATAEPPENAAKPAPKRRTTTRKKKSG